MLRLPLAAAAAAQPNLRGNGLPEGHQSRVERVAVVEAKHFHRWQVHGGAFITG